MKNVKMVLTALAIFAVVGGALAFKTTTFFEGSYCASTIQNSGCAVVSNMHQVSGVTNYYIDPNWDGNPAGCNSTVCGTAVRLIPG